MSKNILYKLYETLFKLLLLVIIASSCTNEESNNEKKPNFLIMLADDMGYGDPACYGGVSQTPNLNSLAEKGKRFTDFYAAAPNCSPSRAGLLTGRAPSMVGIYSYRPPNHPMHLRSNEITIAEILKNHGYQNSIFGKWHLGCLPQDSVLNHPQPDEQGFDYFFATENNAQPSHLNPVNFVKNGEPLGEIKGYSCQIIAGEAISWLENHYKEEEPFFMYLPFHEPHAKVASPPELVEKYNQYPPKDAEYLANIENLDLAIGQIIDYLKKKNIFNNTFILFASDNGSYRKASNGNLKAVKSYLYDGGIRVPGIIHWSALNNKSNNTIHEPAGLVDILPTICDILKIDPPDDKIMDGTSILNLIKGENFNRENPLFWFFYRTSPEIAVRTGNFMIMGKDNDTIPRTHQFAARDMNYIKNMDIKKYELYDLSDDISQSNNIFETHPDSNKYKKIVNDKLEEIQTQGYKWENLPLLENKRRILKTEFNKY